MRRKTLARYAASRLETFLTQLANLRPEDEAGLRFVRKYGHMLSDLPSSEQWRHPFVATTPEQLDLARAKNLQHELQCIWRSGTREARQFRVLMLAKWAQESGSFTFMLSPEAMHPGPFAQALLYLLNSDRALICGNPKCLAPYLFRPRDKKRQVYCSDLCAEFGQRESKKKWWADKGDEWRKRRQSTQGRTLKKGRKGDKHGTRKTR
jgi:hypothetical protein